MRVLVGLFAAFSAVTYAKLVRDVSHTAFDQLLKDNDLVLTAFTSKTLESLQSFQLMFEQASKDSYTPFTIVNCDEEVELCRKYDVNAYPAIRLFKKSAEPGGGEESNTGEPEVVRFRGKKTKSAIDSFLTKHELPALAHVGPKEFTDFKKIDDVVIVGYLRPDQDSLLETLRSVAERYQFKYVFGYVTDTASADAEGLAMPAVVAYKNLDGDSRVMQGHFKEQDLETFLDGVSDLTIGEFSEREIENYMVKGKLTVYLFIQDDDSARQLRIELTPLAKKYAQYANFAITDAIEFAPMAVNYGLTENVYPSLVVHAPMNDHVFRYRQGKRIETLRVEDMLTTILRSKAANGQVFGGDAPDLYAEEEEEHVSEGDGRHDEL